MSSILGGYKLEEWYDDYPIYTYVNPNDICPKEIAILTESQAPADDVVPFTDSMDNKTPSNSKYSEKFVKENLRDISLVDTENLFSSSNYQATSPNAYLNQIYPISEIPNPVNANQARLPLQHQLDLRKDKFNERQKRLKEHFESQPLPKVPPSYNSSGRKLSGRERQLDLERQVSEQLQLRTNFRNQISQLEQKCEKLKALLARIVEASPVYDDKLMQYLNESDLLDNELEGQNHVTIGYTE